jgi:hypothetical protein
MTETGALTVLGELDYTGGLGAVASRMTGDLIAALLESGDTPAVSPAIMYLALRLRMAAKGERASLTNLTKMLADALRNPGVWAKVYDGAFILVKLEHMLREGFILIDLLPESVEDTTHSLDLRITEKGRLRKAELARLARERPTA